MRLRQPAAIVALVAVAIVAVLRVASALGLSLADGPGLAYAAMTIIEPVLLLLLIALLVSCWLGEPVPAARALTVAALGLTAVLTAVVIGLSVASVIAMPWPRGGSELGIYTWLVAPLTVAGIGLAVQVALLRRPAVPARQSGPIRSELGAEPESEPATPDPELQPTWAPDEAVGTVWRRAGEASPQTAATDWDAAGEAGGWWGAGPDQESAPESRSRTES